MSNLLMEQLAKSKLAKTSEETTKLDESTSLLAYSQASLDSFIANIKNANNQLADSNFYSVNAPTSYYATTHANYTQTTYGHLNTYKYSSYSDGYLPTQHAQTTYTNGVQTSSEGKIVSALNAYDFDTAINMHSIFNKEAENLNPSVEEELEDLKQLSIVDSLKLDSSLSSFAKKYEKKANVGGHTNLVSTKLLPVANQETFVFSGAMSPMYGEKSAYSNTYSQANIYYAHGNYTNVPTPAYSQVTYDKAPHSNHSNYYNHSNHSNSVHVNAGAGASTIAYTQTYTPVYSSKNNFAPIKPQILNQQDLNSMASPITIGYYSYDRNEAKGDSAIISSVLYEVWLRKTTGPNQSDWVMLQRSTSNTYTINPSDPFKRGWTQTSQSYGNYEIKIVPVNSAGTVYESFNRLVPYGTSGNASQTQQHEFRFNEMQGQSITIPFNVALNSEPYVAVENSTTWLNTTLFMDGAIKSDGTPVNYATLNQYEPANYRRGLYITLMVMDNDIGQYLKGRVEIVNRSTGQVIHTTKVIWDNGAEVKYVDTTYYKDGYAYISPDSIPNMEANCKAVIYIDEYYDANCVDRASTTTYTQDFEGPMKSGTSYLYFKVNTAQTLSFDKTQISASSNVTLKPSVSVDVNTSPHLYNSLSKLTYVWSNSPTHTSAGGSETTAHSNVFTVPGEGIWYLHLTAYDKYGKQLTKTLGPLYYSTVGLTLEAPTIKHTDMTDSVSVTQNIFTKPNIPLTYSYAYGYKRTGENTVTWLPYGTDFSRQISDLRLYNGLVEIYTRMKIEETGFVATSLVARVKLSSKLVYSIQNQDDFESVSAPYYDKHGGTGMLANGYKLISDLTPELTNSLKSNQFYYYKYINGKYSMRRYTFFDDPNK